MTETVNKRAVGGASGSVLVVVLWLLVLTGYLAGEYLMHNRAKAGTAIYSKEELRRRLTIDSVTAFFSVKDWIIPEYVYEKGSWMELELDGVKLKVKVDSEEGRVNLNTASDGEVRNEIIKVLGEEAAEEATPISDAVLDWRDTDSLVRSDGAETEYYSELSSPYEPANGNFKTITELMLVRGVDSGFFWGDIAQWVSDDSEDEDNDEDIDEELSFIDSFTIFPKETRRVSVIIPVSKNTSMLSILFLEKKSGNRFVVVEDYTTFFKTLKREEHVDS